MQMEPTYRTPDLTVEQADNLRAVALDYCPTSVRCQCGYCYYDPDKPVSVRTLSYTSPYGWWPAMRHTTEQCSVVEADLQAECQGPTRKLTGAYVGCVSCEPYVFLAETRDSAYLYGVQFDDFEYEVYNGEERLEGVLEVKVGVGGYIIQVRQTPETHFCPCYLLPGDSEPNVCRAYIPGNDFRVVEIPEDED